MSRGDDDDQDTDAPPPHAGELTSKQATQILFRDPGVRNYPFASLAGLVLVFVVMFQRGADVGGLLVVMIGVAGLVLRWTVAPGVFILILVYFIVFPYGIPEMGYASRYEIEDNRFNFSDLLLAGAALVYLACQYRVFGLTQQAMPHEMKFPRKSDKPYRRPPAAITQTEIPRFLYLTAGVVFAGQFLWLIFTSLEVDAERTIPLRIAESQRSLFGRGDQMLSPGATRFVLITGTLFFGTLLARLVFGYWRLRTMRADEANALLLDTGWVETRREYVRLNVWKRWRVKRAEMREAKRKRHANRGKR
jgi:hypothetical protein